MSFACFKQNALNKSNAMGKATGIGRAQGCIFLCIQKALFLAEPLCGVCSIASGLRIQK